MKDDFDFIKAFADVNILQVEAVGTVIGRVVGKLYLGMLEAGVPEGQAAQIIHHAVEAMFAAILREQVNIEIWLEDIDADFPTVKLTGETANNFKVPAVGTGVGAWQDEYNKGTESFNILNVHDVRHYIFRKKDEAQKMPVWTQEIHVMCSAQEIRRRR